jgi:hypothetical protein
LLQENRERTVNGPNVPFVDLRIQHEPIAAEVQEGSDRVFEIAFRMDES